MEHVKELIETLPGVEFVHQPTGLGVVSVSERSQYRNKERALVMLEILVELEEHENKGI